VVAGRVHDLLMHHPTAGAGYVTLSAGVASLVPPRDLQVQVLIKACEAALQRTKKNGKNSVTMAEARDFK
jgi:PleD family two-component response regulator